MQIQTTYNTANLQAQFIGQMDVKESSRRSYDRSLKQFFEWLTASGRIGQRLTRIDILQYKDDLLNNGKSALTVGSYLTIIRQFFEWTEASGFYPNIAKGVKTPRRRQAFKKQPLTDQQPRELIQAADSPRDRALIALIVSTGLRTIEASRAQIGDLTTRAGYCILNIQGKGQNEKNNFVIIPPTVCSIINEYLETRPDAQDQEYLFVSESNNNRGQQMTTRSISRICKNHLNKIGLTGSEYTAHSLRHTAATNMLLAGASLEQVQREMRHTSPATTQIYIETVNDIKRLQDPAVMKLEQMYFN